MKRFSKAICLAAAMGTALAPAVVQADETAPYVLDPTKGYLGCDIDMTDTIENIQLGLAMEMAEEAGAPGFLYWADNEYLVMFKEPYPADCDSPPVSNWPVYMANKSIQFYQKAAFGFEGCGMELSDPITNMSMSGIFRMARDKEATGFVYNEATATGRVFLGAFPQDCTPEADPEWALYLGQN